jgi:hypothetical protein
VVSLADFGQEPDYAIAAIKGNGTHKYRLSISQQAGQGERLVVAHDRKGNSRIGLIGIHIAK